MYAEQLMQSKVTLKRIWQSEEKNCRNMICLRGWGRKKSICKLKIVNLKVRNTYIYKVNNVKFQGPHKRFHKEQKTEQKSKCWSL